ncbi:MAG: hypothetical protein HOV80_19735 [Polyangiaceae bacterium]|nr:hypothetical protein [Polyangiaceae bacterium]
MAGEPPKVSGVMVRAHMEALRKRLGTEAFDRLIAELPPNTRDQLTLITAVSWVSFPVVERFYEAAAKMRGTSVEELHTEIASRVTGQAISTVWKALLRVVGDEALLSRAPSLFKKAYPQGAMEVAKSGKGFAELRVVEWPHMSEFQLRGLRVGIESTLRSAGRKNPKGSVKRTADGALFRFDWSE